MHTARTADAGLNSQLAAVLDTEAGTVFVKGLRVDHPGVVRQGREAMINPFVRSVAPRLLWHDQVAGWDLLAFEYVDGGLDFADYSPGSPDLARVIDAMHRLAAIGCPDLPVKQARQRWAAYVDCEADLELLDGDALWHTDFNPLNILLGLDRAESSMGLADTRRGVHRRGLLPDPGHGGWSQCRQPGRGAGRRVPGLAASPVRGH